MLPLDRASCCATIHSRKRLAPLASGRRRLLRCRLVTIDERLLPGIAPLEIAVDPREI
jgi:hypothetical protein